MLGVDWVLLVQKFVSCAVKPCFLCEIAVLTESIWISVSYPIHSAALCVEVTQPRLTFIWQSHPACNPDLTPLTPFAPRPQTPLSAPAPHHECLF